MDTLFFVETIYEERDFIGFMRAFTMKTDNIRNMSKITRIATKVAGGVFIAAAAINIAMMAVNFANGLPNPALNHILMQVAMIGLGIFALWLPVDDLSGKRTWRKYEGQGAKIAFDFNQKSYSRLLQGNVIPVKYESISAIYEDDDRFYLFVSETSAHIICKDKFKTGDSTGFAEFIAKRTGHDIITVKL